MLNDKEVFSFELNESLYFNKGQEIVEMIGISLDPKISIQPLNDYVSIRGVIELQGEYFKSSSEAIEDDNLDFDDYHFRRYLEKVEDTADNRAVFSHRFPVEISVPSYRVTNINDITVSIETFDYEIQNEQELKIKSTVEIHGINEQIRDSEEISEESNVEDFADETFEFDIKEGKEEKVNAEVIEVNQEKVHEEITNENIIPDVESAEEKDKADDSGRWKFEKSQTFAEFFEEKPVKGDKKAQDKELITDDSEEVMSEQEDEIADDHVELVEEEQEEILLDREEETVLETSEDVSYLANMFRGEGDKDRYTQMRVCIVQQTDTIETISERYNIPTLQLLNKNHLDDDNIVAGQLLQIPQRQTEI